MATLARYLKGLVVPWKVATFVLGTAFFVWGAYFWDVPTWDVGVSILMSVLCYLLAPWSVPLMIGAVRGRGPRWRRDFLVGAVVVYFVASGSYEIYNTLRMGEHPVTYWWNLAFSVPVTVIAGVVWSYDGSLSELAGEVRRAVRSRRS